MTEDQAFERRAGTPWLKLGGGQDATHRPEMDGVPITVLQGKRAIRAVCRPQFTLLPAEFRWYPTCLSPTRGSVDWSATIERFDAEGVTWIRGHFGPKSHEVKAMLAARAL